MSTVIKNLFRLVILLSLASLQANDATPTLVLRSQGRHADRQEMVGMTNYIHQTDNYGNYTVFDMAIAYAQSFRSNRLATSLFGSDVTCDCGATITVQGSNAVNSGAINERDPQAWLADYLYLNCDFVGEFTVTPKIQNVMVDLDLYVGLNNILEGSYFRIYGPITWTKWQTQFCSTSDTDITSSCEFGGIGYFTPDGSEVLLSKLSDYFIGKAPSVAGGVTFQPLKYAKMGASCDMCDITHAGFADLRAQLGYEFWREEDYHFGLNIQTAAPTGNRRRAEFVMQPVIGNGNHWELGGGLDFHYTFWRGETEDRSFTFLVNADITHLFHGNEQRTFDLNDKTNSRYMLASLMTRNVVDNLEGIADDITTYYPIFIPSTYQFNYEYAPVANLTTLNVSVDIGVQADIVAMFSYKCNSFNFDFGYNFWGRSCENFGCPTDCDPCSQSLCSLNGQNLWALKGDARMFGYSIDGYFVDNTAIPLGSSESRADIHGGTNINATVDDPNLGLIINPRMQNIGVDNPLVAIAVFPTGSPEGLYFAPSTSGGTNTSGQQIITSIQTVLLNCNDIDFEATKGISNTIFANFSYNWEKDTRSSFLGIGASAEFGKAPSCCNTNRNCGQYDDCGKNCINSAVSQWTVWIKGGVAFN